MLVTTAFTRQKNSFQVFDIQKLNLFVCGGVRIAQYWSLLESLDTFWLQQRFFEKVSIVLELDNLFASTVPLLQSTQ